MKNNHFPPESEVPEVPANIFNEFRYYKDESQHVSDEDPLLSGSSESGLKFVPIDDNKVMVLLQSLTQSVTPGTDEIDARLLKNCCSVHLCSHMPHSEQEHHPWCVSISVEEFQNITSFTEQKR